MVTIMIKSRSQWNSEVEGHLHSKPCRVYGHHRRPHQGFQQVFPPHHWDYIILSLSSFHYNSFIMMQLHQNCSKLWVLYFAMVFGMLANTITTTSRSNLSKLMEEQEVRWQQWWWHWRYFKLLMFISVTQNDK